MNFQNVSNRASRDIPKWKCGNIFNRNIGTIICTGTLASRCTQHALCGWLLSPSFSAPTTTIRFSSCQRPQIIIKINRNSVKKCYTSYGSSSTLTRCNCRACACASRSARRWFSVSCSDQRCKSPLSSPLSA